MFTGLIQDLGRVSEVDRTEDGVRLTVDTGARRRSSRWATRWRSTASA